MGCGTSISCISIEEMVSETITVTFGDCGENHAGMQIIGEPAEKGLSKSDLLKIQSYYSEKKLETRLVDFAPENKCILKFLNEVSKLGVDIEDVRRAWGLLPEAYVLIVKGALDSDILSELKTLEWDKKAFMYGRVVNKLARHNLLFSEKAQEPDYEKGKGRIVSWMDLPLLSHVKKELEDLIGRPLIGEGNRYYDVKKCGISPHGDTERKIVIGCRFGAGMPLVYQWYLDSRPISEKIVLEIEGGDMYFMSDKAVGHDWKRKVIPTLRHSAGCTKYTGV